ncbi:hypothetical protein AX16_002767 [Volvariella volvacea WC 439]|nr:hypothetical protein AX16_002767 [Volvariella volvacea WC 439]
MPVDPTRPVPTRRPQRKITEEELKDIELKRIRGELSCAECRRLKLRCDKKVPCGSCQRRGCESICPCGILSAGQGTRFILADTEQLHQKISEMSHRIRSLEDGLAILQASVSNERHPLLRDDLLKVKFGAETLRSDKKSLKHLEEQTKQSIDALGTLTLTDEGDVKYFGSSAGSETLMMAEEEEWSSSNEDDSESHTSLPPELQKLTNLFPFTSNHNLSAYNPLNPNLYDPSHNNNPVPNYDHLVNLLVSLLPSYERAWALCDSYVNHGAYFFRPMKKEDIFEHLLPSIYEARKIRIGNDGTSMEVTTTKVEEGGDEVLSSPAAAAPASASAAASPLTVGSSPSVSSSTTSPPASDDYASTTQPQPAAQRTTILTSSPHSLVVLYFIFALGALLDLNLPPYNAEGEYYFDIGRAAMALRPVFDSPQVDTVQALGVMATYLSLAGKKYKRDSAWCVMSLASKLAQSIGLHRDSARWHMDARTVEKRRLLFWEVFACDVSHSLALGRPPSIHPSYVDSEFPVDEEATLSDTGEIQNGFWRMKYTFARDLFMGVAETTLTAQSPSYTTVLNLDRKVRQLSFPASFKPYALREDGEAEFFSSSLSLRDFYASQHRTVTMIYLHRSFFAQAMLDHPNNPLLSPFAPSFLTAYRCASVIIRATAHHFERCAEMAMRIWFLLYHTFSAAIIVGTVVTRSPHLNVAQSALNELDLAVSLFERTATQSLRARVALGVLRKLQEKAHLARSAHNSGIPNNPSSQLNLSDFGNIDDKLAIFGGQTRVVVAKKTRHKHSHSGQVTGTAGGTGMGGNASQENSPSPSADGSISSPTSSPGSVTRTAQSHIGSSAAETSSDMSMTGIQSSANVNLSAAMGMEMNVDVHPSLEEYLDSGLFPPLYPTHPFEPYHQQQFTAQQRPQLSIPQTTPPNTSTSPSAVSSFAHGGGSGPAPSTFGQSRSPNMVGELPSLTRLQNGSSGASIPQGGGGTLEEMYANFIGYGNTSASSRPATSGPPGPPGSSTASASASASTSTLSSPTTSTTAGTGSVLQSPISGQDSRMVSPLAPQRGQPWNDSAWAQSRPQSQQHNLLSVPGHQSHGLQQQPPQAVRPNPPPPTTSRLVQQHAGPGLYNQLPSHQQPQPQLQQLQQHQRRVSLTQHLVNQPQNGASSSNQHHHAAGMGVPGQAQSQPQPAFAGSSAANYAAYLQSLSGYAPGQGPTAAAPSAPVFGGGAGVAPGVMVEMGLSTESGMDAAWLSFMRDCGILDAGAMGNIPSIAGNPFIGNTAAAGIIGNASLYGMVGTQGQQGPNGIATSAVGYGMPSGPGPVAVPNPHVRGLLAMRGQNTDSTPDGGVVKVGV